MAAIIWTEPALDELEALADYIALDKPGAASSLVGRVFSHVELLAEHPELGPAVPELRPSSRYRQLVEPPCRIFYRHDKATGKLYILGVMRGEKLFHKRLLQRRDRMADSAS
ncbi:MAG TPA: type II toxin-antitoxin system RelE/ParE family toxin [Dongiaceae bacterium]|nr:type II toxin-antitoxin system RelE/ParE family toxin [Dongiaceae bacterium]